MTLCPAQFFDIPQIMAIEHAAFIPQIQEKQRVFEKRLETFPEGFFVISDTSEQALQQTGKAVIAGYFCSERWGTVPESNLFFALGHDVTKFHAKDGPVLYVSSFALLPQYHGKGLGLPFFKLSLNAVCCAEPGITTIALLVNREWTQAIKIYHALGFTERRYLKAFFPSLTATAGSDGLLMTAESSLFHDPAQLIEREGLAVIIKPREKA